MTLNVIVLKSEKIFKSQSKVESTNTSREYKLLEGDGSTDERMGLITKNVRCSVLLHSKRHTKRRRRESALSDLMYLHIIRVNVRACVRVGPGNQFWYRLPIVMRGLFLTNDCAT